MTGKVESKTKNTGKRWVRRLGALWLALTAACTGAGMPALAETSIPNQTQQQSAAVPVSGETATAETSVKTAAVENETGAGETGTQAAGNILTDTVSPVGTTINLFDYWITTRFALDNVNPADMDQDINAGKLLQFTAAAPPQPQRRRQRLHRQRQAPHRHCAEHPAKRVSRAVPGGPVPGLPLQPQPGQCGQGVLSRGAQPAADRRPALVANTKAGSG